MFHKALMNEGYPLDIATNHLLLTTSLDADAKLGLCFHIEHGISVSRV